MTPPRSLAQDARRATTVAAAFLCFLCAPLPAAAMDHTQHPRTHPAAPNRESILVHRAPTPLVHPSKRTASHEVVRHATKAPATAHNVSSRASSHGHAPKEPLLVHTSGKHSASLRAVAAPASRPVAKPLRSAASGPRPGKVVSFDDLTRAQEPPPAHTTPAAFSAGVSHPDEMNEEQPLNLPAAASATKHATVLPKVSAAGAPPATAETTRVDGFGAEGAVLGTGHRTLAATMAAHRSELETVTAKALEPTPVERAEMTEEAIKPIALPSIYDRSGRLVMPAALKGSHEVLVHQNTMADAAGLERIQDEDALQHLISTHDLVRLPESSSLEVNGDLPIERRYARPWTVRFATETAKAFNQHFGDALRVNSAVRTVSYQLRLTHVNGNAAGISGESASPHLTGQAIDIGKRGMSKAQIAWMRAYLGPLMTAGKIDVEEEFQQACFHISVYRTYLPAAKKLAKLEVASAATPSEKRIVSAPVAVIAAPLSTEP